jgi:hypothetical protein
MKLKLIQFTLEASMSITSSERGVSRSFNIWFPVPCCFKILLASLRNSETRDLILMTSFSLSLALQVIKEEFAITHRQNLL